MENKLKITVGIPTNRGVKAKTIFSLLEMVVFSKHIFHFVIATEGYTIAENRAYITTQALKNKSDYLLFCDDDMVFPPDTLERLLAHKKDVIGVASHSRCLPLKTTVQLLDGTVSAEFPKELLEVKQVGTGIMLIDIKVFEKIDKPYFNTKSHENGFTLMGEDAWFCSQAKQAGFHIYCDGSLKIGHVGDYIF